MRQGLAILGGLCLSACTTLPEGDVPATLKQLEGRYEIVSLGGYSVRNGDEGRVEIDGDLLLASYGCNTLSGEVELGSGGMLRYRDWPDGQGFEATVKGCRLTGEPRGPSALEVREDALFDLLGNPVTVRMLADGHVSMSRGRQVLRLAPDP